jgi:uncharacterized membrane protein
MKGLEFIHVISVILWGGCAFADILLEFYIWSSREEATQRACSKAHEFLDRVLEGPALLLAVASGLLLAWKSGRLQPVPGWLAWKSACVAVVFAANLICVRLVARRQAAIEKTPRGALPFDDPEVQRWNGWVKATFLATPLGFLAVWLAVNP